LLLLTAIGLSAGGSGHFTCNKNMNLVTDKSSFKSGGLHDKHVVATGKKQEPSQHSDASTRDRLIYVLIQKKQAYLYKIME
jgi:hypothetical protein